MATSVILRPRSRVAPGGADHPNVSKTALQTREGASKLVEACTYPLTSVGCVTRVYTGKAVFLTGLDGVTVREAFGCTLEELQKLLPLPLKAS